MKFKNEKVKIQIEEKEYELFYDLNAYAELEDRCGSIEKALNSLQEGSLKAMRLILWAGLIHEGTTYDELSGEAVKYSITLADVGKIINAANMKEVTEGISKAIVAGMPEEKEQKNEATT